MKQWWRHALRSTSERATPSLTMACHWLGYFCANPYFVPDFSWAGSFAASPGTPSAPAGTVIDEPVNASSSGS